MTKSEYQFAWRLARGLRQYDSLFVGVGTRVGYSNAVIANLIDAASAVSPYLYHKYTWLDDIRELRMRYWKSTSNQYVNYVHSLSTREYSYMVGSI